MTSYLHSEPLENADVRVLTDGREVLVIPFPLTTGQFATLELPNEPLTRGDADRLGAFLRTLSRECPECGGERPGCSCDYRDEFDECNGPRDCVGTERGCRHCR